MRRDRPVTALWRRLDRPGHDACKLEFTGAAWVLSGAAAFHDDAGPALLNYRVVAGEAWETRVARVTGWIGEHPIDWTIQHDAEGWRLDGRKAPGLDDCHDVDFGFTPATNLLQLNRLDLGIGERADFAVAWIDVGSAGLSAVRQVYERKTEATYAYESPDHRYAAVLEIDATSFVANYPRLWALER